jgi:hypothetical protein
MKPLSSLLLVSLCIGVAAPVAARPRVPAAAWPGVGDVLLNLTVNAPLATVPVVPLPTWMGIKDSPVPVPVTMWCADLTLLRLSAEFRRWDGDEDFTTLPPAGTSGGISIYTKTVDVPDTCDTLYVTISATGDAHGGSQILLTCLVDGAFCNPGGAFATVPGWIALQRHGPVDDFHDNNVNYQWCKQVTPGSRVTVQIRLAKGDGLAATGVAILQQEHFYIDASQTSGGCVAGSTD